MAISTPTPTSDPTKIAALSWSTAVAASWRKGPLTNGTIASSTDASSTIRAKPAGRGSLSARRPPIA